MMFLDFIYEDAFLLVLNKPQGLVVMPGVRTGQTLIDVLNVYSPCFSQDCLVHRLDQEAQGLMVIAKTVDVKMALQAQFQLRQVKKKYYAMVRGNVKNDDYVLTQPIGRDLKNPLKKRVLKEGKEAYTVIQVLKRYNTQTLVDVEIKTGRTHQIRVHLSSLGYPIIGDSVYGTRTSSKRLKLQAYFLGFRHPFHHGWMTFELPIAILA